MRNTVWVTMSARRRGETRLTLSVMNGVLWSRRRWEHVLSGHLVTGYVAKKTFSSHGRPEKAT